jgi:ribosome-associated toxin RatA of RatAB toxin-antitoxin module
VACSKGTVCRVAEKTTQTIDIYAEPGKVMSVIADIAAYPEWVSEYEATEVLETDADGRVKRARLVMDAGIIKDTQVLEYHWAPDGRTVTWELAESALLRSLEGKYLLSPRGSGTEVTYELTVDLLIPMIGMLKRKAERKITDSALKDLKKRVESDH